MTGHHPTTKWSYEMNNIQPVATSTGPEDAVLDELEVAQPRTVTINGVSIQFPGKPVRSLANVCKILEMDSRCRGEIRYNSFRNVIEYRGEPIKDANVTEIIIWMDDIYQIKAGKDTAFMAVEYTAQANEYHPLREYLNGLEWDGAPRVDTWLGDYMGVNDTGLVRVMARKFLVSMVARAHAELPLGEKVDTTLVLVGGQGTGKSTALAELVGRQWFSDTALDLGNPDKSMERIQGVWLYEFAELDSIRGKEATRVKSFLTGVIDKFRPAYGRFDKHFARNVVFAGTTNNEDGGFLNDPTGSRRFWPVMVGSIDLEGLKAARGQLWAEAMTLWSAGEDWWLDESEADLLKSNNEDFATADVWTESIVSYLDGPPRIFSASVAEVLSSAIDMDKDKRGPRHMSRVASILTELGWTQKRTLIDGRKVRRWHRPE
jgi:putative DNA primase/helicase